MDNIDDLKYKQKYLKYKRKYLLLKGGEIRFYNKNNLCETQKCNSNICNKKGECDPFDCLNKEKDCLGKKKEYITKIGVTNTENAVYTQEVHQAIQDISKLLTNLGIMVPPFVDTYKYIIDSDFILPKEEYDILDNFVTSIINKLTISNFTKDDYKNIRIIHDSLGLHKAIGTDYDDFIKTKNILTPRTDIASTNKEILTIPLDTSPDNDLVKLYAYIRITEPKLEPLSAYGFTQRDSIKNLYISKMNKENNTWLTTYEMDKYKYLTEFNGHKYTYTQTAGSKFKLSNL